LKNRVFNSLLKACRRGDGIILFGFQLKGLFCPGRFVRRFGFRLFLLLVFVRGAGYAHASESLVVVYRLDSAPLQFRNSQGEADGVFIDLWKIWSKKTGIPIEFLGAYNKEAQMLLKEGKADVLAGLFSNARREQFLDFSDPVLSTSYYLYVRENLKDIETVDDMGNHSVAVTAASYHEDYLRKNFPELPLQLYKGYQEVFSAAAREEMDALVTQPLYLQYIASKLHLHLPYRQVAPALYERAYRAAVRKGRENLLSSINQGLSLISSEERSEISTKWTGLGWSENMHYSMGLTPEEVAWLKEHPIIPIGGESDWPPFDFTDKNGRHRGVAAEYLKKISELLGVEFKVTTHLPWNEVMSKVRNGELFAACTIVATPGRRKDFLFTKPYYSSAAAMVVKRGNQSIRKLDDLADKRVAVVKGYSVAEYLRRRFPGFIQIEVENLLQGLSVVNEGKADAIVDNQDVLAWLMEEHAIPDMRLIRIQDLFRGNTNLRMGVSREYPLFASILQKALDAIPLQEQKYILAHWLPGSSIESSSDRVYLSLEDQQWLSEHPDIRVGINLEWPPIEYIDSEGKYQGVTSDYLSLMSSWLGTELKPEKHPDWVTVMEYVKNRKIDLLPAVVQSEKRNEYLGFTKPYLHFPVVIFTRTSNRFLTDLSELQGQKVSVEKVYITEEYLRRDYPNIHLLIAENPLEGLKKLSLGEVDAYVGNLATASSLLQRYGLVNIKVAAPTPYTLDLRMGVRKDWPELVSILNTLLTGMNESQHSAIRKKWLQVEYDVQMDYQLLWRVIVLSITVVLIILIWVYLIRGQREKLRRSEEQLTQLLEAIPIPIVVADKKGEILFANPQVGMEVESATGSMIGRNMQEFYPEVSQRKEILQGLQTDARLDRKLVHLCTDQGNIIEGFMSAIPIQMEGKKVHLGMFFNLTEQFRMEKELEIAKADAEKANAFKSQFLASMSHEIRTPMNAILGLSHLCNQTSLNSIQQNYLKHIDSSARVLLGIINDILDVSKIEAGKLVLENKLFSLWEVLEQVSTLNAVAAKDKGIELLFRVQPGMPGCYIGDPLRLSQVLINLTQNAIKFTDSGEVIIDISLISENANSVSLRFSVIDTGIGIAREDIPYLFDAFTQVDQSYARRFSGTGLGLAISKMLVDLMGGDIQVDSKPGKGSSFVFVLSLTAGDMPDENAGIQNALKGKTACLIERNANVRMIVREMLLEFGMQVDVFEGVDGMLERVNTGAMVVPDIIVSDSCILHGKMLQTVKNTIHGEVLLFVLRGVGEIVVEEEDIRYLHKPVIPWVLEEMLSSAVAGISYQDTELNSARSNRKRLKGEILLVEDNSINQLVAKEILEQFGLFVHVAENGKAALNMLSGKAFDLVLLDVQMPEMDGYEVARRVRADLELTDLPVIAMTAHALIGDREKSLEAGMNEHLSKPIDPDELFQTLAEWLPGRGGPDLMARGGTAVDQLFSSQSDYIDIQWGLSRIGGNQQLFQRLLRQFLNDHGDAVSELEQFLLHDDMLSAGRLAHTIHGVAATIGARKLARASDAVEQSLLNKVEDYRFVAEQFRRNFDWVVKDLERLLKSSDDIENKTINRNDISASLTLKEILVLIKKASPDALYKLQEMDLSDIAPDKVVYIDRIKNELKNYEFSSAKEILSSLLEEMEEING
jgi:PAS domain S-box-containing protein